MLSRPSLCNSEVKLKLARGSHNSSCRDREADKGSTEGWWADVVTGMQISAQMIQAAPDQSGHESCPLLWWKLTQRLPCISSSFYTPVENLVNRSCCSPLTHLRPPYMGFFKEGTDKVKMGVTHKKGYNSDHTTVASLPFLTIPPP